MLCFTIVAIAANAEDNQDILIHHAVLDFEACCEGGCDLYVGLTTGLWGVREGPPRPVPVKPAPLAGLPVPVSIVCRGLNGFWGSHGYPRFVRHRGM